MAGGKGGRSASSAGRLIDGANLFWVISYSSCSENCYVRGSARSFSHRSLLLGARASELACMGFGGAEGKIYFYACNARAGCNMRDEVSRASACVVDAGAGDALLS